MQAPRQGRWSATFFEAGFAILLFAGACALEFAASALAPPAAAAVPSSPSKRVSSSSSDVPRQAAAASGTPVLVELFTSEGCSSCPPADRLLARLAADQPVAGALVVPLSLHVDYWNRLGWVDPFSSAAFTERQGAYAARFGNGGRVYTPQMVVDGLAELVGSDERAARRAIAASATGTKALVKIEAGAVPGSARVTVSGAPGAGADVVLAVAEDAGVSEVTRGENAGTRLTHVAVAREIRVLGTVDGGGRFGGNIALTALRGTGPRHLLAFVQEPGTGRVLGASVPFRAP